MPYICDKHKMYSFIQISVS